jgi:two-component system sensor histidine kinase DesK
VSGKAHHFSQLTMRMWYAGAGGWALLMVPQVWAAVTEERPIALRVLFVLVVAGYLACYLHGLYIGVTRREPLLSAGLIVVMLGLWTVMLAGLGHGDGSTLYTVAYLVVAVSLLVDPPYNTPAILLTCLVAPGIGWLVGERMEWSAVISMVALGLGMVVMVNMIRVNGQLNEAREELARMAVAADRERMARDLHDVLGHSLTTITVKAGLARRLLERGEDGRAAVEVGDVERLGRQALSDVRATVAANRVTSLAHELAGAREALRAAEIHADLPVAVDDVPGEHQQAFAHVVREGVTNTIRHSGASTCTIRLTPDSVEVVDDGVGAPAGAAAGHGISGLGERLAAIGGRVEAGPIDTGGYRLCAHVPVRQGTRA